MSEKNTPPSGGKVIAEIQNGQVYELLMTSEGLKYCRVQDLRRIAVWKPVSSFAVLMNELAEGVPDDQVRVYWTDQPNDPKPRLNHGCTGLSCVRGRRLDFQFNPATGAVIMMD